MPNYQENDNYVRDLKDAADFQSRLQDELEIDTQDNSACISGSRAAMLALIDLLARQSLPMLGVLAAGTVCIAAVSGFGAESLNTALIGRILLWVAIVAACILFTLHSLHQFRRGLAYSGRPFTWRSQYTATLAVLSTAIGAGAILLTPAQVQPQHALLLNCLIIILGLIFSAGHLAHRTAALSAGLPVVLLALPASLWHILPTTTALSQQYLFIWAGSVAVVILSFFWAHNRAIKLIDNALQQHPRNEMLQIKARQKKSSGAYNPFSFRLKESSRAHSSLLEAERAVAGSDRRH